MLRRTSLISPYPRGLNSANVMFLPHSPDIHRRGPNDKMDYKSAKIDVDRGNGPDSIGD